MKNESKNSKQKIQKIIEIRKETKKGIKQVISFGTFGRRYKKLTVQKVKSKRKSWLELQPILLGKMSTKKNIIILELFNRKIELRSTDKKTIKMLVKIFSLCNGIRTINKIFSETPECTFYKKKDLFSLFKNLISEMILIDSREFYSIFHKQFIYNPTAVYYDLTNYDIFSFFKQSNEIKYNGENIPLREVQSNFLKILSQRKSTREFRRKKMPFQIFSGILYAAYGLLKRKLLLFNKSISVRTTPSAGALYPLHIYCFVIGDVENLHRGIYYLMKNENFIKCIRKVSNPRRILNMFLTKPVKKEKEMIQNASILIAVTCDFKRITQKYSNRGYLYALLETGHVAQNLYLFCTEQNLGVVEIGGFQEKELLRVLGVEHLPLIPLTCLLIGYPAEEGNRNINFY